MDAKRKCSKSDVFKTKTYEFGHSLSHRHTVCGRGVHWEWEYEGPNQNHGVGRFYFHAYNQIFWTKKCMHIG